MPIEDPAIFSVDGLYTPLFDQGFGGEQSAFEVITSLADLPTPSGSVITLQPNTAYYFTTTVDLLGNRLVGAANSVLLGPSSEVARITSTGLDPGQWLLTSTTTLILKDLTIQDVQKGVSLDGSATPGNVAADWTGVNFENVPEAWLINQSTNFIYDKGAFLNSTGGRFEGTIGTVALNNSLFSGTGSAANIIELGATLSITRRFRLTYSSVVAFGSTVGIAVTPGASVPVEGYILDTINFSGGGTYQTGLTYLDNQSRFTECRGITNTTSVGYMFMANNATVTPLDVDVAAKISGSTTASTLNQRFSHSTGRLTYTGALTKSFEVTVATSYKCPGASQEIVGIYIAKNGAIIPESEMYSKTDTSGSPMTCTNLSILTLQTDDYVEVFIENATSNADILVEFMSVSVKALN